MEHSDPNLNINETKPNCNFNCNCRKYINDIGGTEIAYLGTLAFIFGIAYLISRSMSS